MSKKRKSRNTKKGIKALKKKRAMYQIGGKIGGKLSNNPPEVELKRPDDNPEDFTEQFDATRGVRSAINPYQTQAQQGFTTDSQVQALDSATPVTTQGVQAPTMAPAGS